MVDKRIDAQGFSQDQEIDITHMPLVEKIILFQNLTHSMAIAAGGEEEYRIKRKSKQLVEDLLTQIEKEEKDKSDRQ